MAAEKCIGVADPDLLNVCLNLQSQIEGLAVDRWVTVLVGVGAALLTVIGTSWSTHSVQRIERLNTSQRKAIVAVQDAAATLRSNWAQFLEFLNLDRPPGAPGPDMSASPFSDIQQSRLMGDLETKISRVGDAATRESHVAWLEYAQGYFSGQSDRQVSEEEKLWTTAVNASGRALRYLDEPQRRWYRPWVWFKPVKEG